MIKNSNLFMCGDYKCEVSLRNVSNIECVISLSEGVYLLVMSFKFNKKRI